MRIVLAPDKFKGCLSAVAVCQAMARGLALSHPNADVIHCPLADGGEGTVAALVGALGGQFMRERVTGPLAEIKVDATWGLLSDGAAVIEMAAASGLALLSPDQYDPMAATTFGTGELIAAARRHGANRLILGLGGSATIDAGVGCAQACGFTVLTRDGEPTRPTEPLGGRDVPNILMIKHGRGEITSGMTIEAACDVSSPLCGPTGASMMFGPQKGATPEQVKWFDWELEALAARTGNNEAALTPGAGAAGGMGFGLKAFFGAKLRAGSELVIEATRLREHLNGADLCLTGEGTFDESSGRGKVVGAVARLCREMGVQCNAIAGIVEQASVEGITRIIELCRSPMTRETCKRDAAMLIERAGAHLSRD